MNALKRWSRKLPHIQFDNAIYFITIRSIGGVMNSDERKIMLSHLISGSPSYYKLFAAVIMPDHVHFIARPNSGIELSRMMKGIKGVSSRKINVYRNSKGTVWQAEYWDRVIRDEEEFVQKLKYMYENPIRKQIVRRPEDWDSWFYDID